MGIGSSKPSRDLSNPVIRAGLGTEPRGEPLER